jgi:diacylglycerol kinase family enzyme
VGVARIGIVSNANCRDNRRGVGDDQRFASILGDRGSVAVTTTHAELAAAIERFRSERIDYLGIHGGDGSIHHTLTALIRGYAGHPLPRIVVLRGGTMNTLARGLGIRGARGAGPAVLGELVARVFGGAAPRLTRRHVVRVGDRYGLIFGNGVMHAFASEYYARGTPKPWSAAQLLSRVVGSALVGGPLATRLVQAFTGRIELDGRALPRTRFLTLAVASVPEAGYGFALLPHATDALDGLAVTAIHTSPRALVAEMPKMLARRPLSPERCTLAVARGVTLVADTPVGYTLDGDCYVDDARTEIAAGPRLEIVVPAAA